MREVGSVFEHALGLETAKREAFICERLEREPELRAEVERLLAAHALEGPVDRLMTEMDAAAGEPARAPVRVGVWRLKTLIGRGGMGSVYCAERADGQ